jgi:hypothetical protein
MNMMTVGGNPFQIARPSRAQRFRLRDWLPGACAILGAAIFAMGVSSNAWAKKSGPLATTVWVANGGAFNAGSLETFAAGSKKNTKPLYRNVGPETLLQSFPGSPFLATGPAGVALTPDSPGHVSVVGQLINAVLTFSPTANGDTPPETVLAGPDTLLGTPGGDTYGPSPYYFDSHSQAVVSYYNELYVTNIASVFPLPSPLPSSAPTPVVAASITEYPEGADGDYVPDEVIGGDPAVTVLFEPVGIYVDTTYYDLCIGVADNATDLCDYPELFFEDYTRRVWVVQPAIGLVSLFVPDAACSISAILFSPFAPWCPGGSFNPALQSNVAEQPPLGGTFFTTEDGLTPAALGGTSADPTEPNFLAVQQYASLPEVYITDLLGGFHGQGRIKFFYTVPFDQCLVPELATDGVTVIGCLVATRGGLFGIPDGTIEGRKAMLGKPMGIASMPIMAPAAGSQSSSYDDNLFVTNIDRNNIVQFSSTERGNISPDAFIRGKHAKMNQPTGIGIMSPDMLLGTQQSP